MLLWQGVAAFKLYTGCDMPVKEVKELLFQLNARGKEMADYIEVRGVKSGAGVPKTVCVPVERNDGGGDNESCGRSGRGGGKPDVVEWRAD